MSAKGLRSPRLQCALTLALPRLSAASNRPSPRPHQQESHQDRQGRPGPRCPRSPRCLSIGRAAPFGQALRRLGVTDKKTRSPPKASKDGRRAFCARIKAHEAASRAIVSIDESGFANDMPRPHGYAAKGKRCPGSHAWEARSRSNVIEALLAGVLPAVRFQ